MSWSRCSRACTTTASTTRQPATSPSRPRPKCRPRSGGALFTVHVNAERFAELPVNRLAAAVSHVLAREGVAEAELSVTFLGDADIEDMNQRYLGHAGPTDVLSFPMYESGEPVLGDIYIGAEQAARQARELGVGLEEELVRLTVHGVLHVLGHDHAEGPERTDSGFFLRQEHLVREFFDNPASR